jgi:hypothetical protein
MKKMNYNSCELEEIGLSHGTNGLKGLLFTLKTPPH